MPPKKGSSVAKQEVAKKQKAVEDKTFGLKNKNKSSKVQKYVQHLTSGVDNAKKQAGLDNKDASKKKRDAEAAREKELNEIFKVAIQQPKIPLGVDPKSIVCEFFRHGRCAKGFKCKYSHDLSVERKSEKIDLYSDQRDDEDNMEDWDQSKLEEVVATKGNEYKNSNKPTDIVCKHFLEAVEKKQYGWFWSCPNGGKDCQYRHALPPGYVLKSQMKALLEEESANKVSIEEMIENKRQEVKASTQLTAEVFAEWKSKKAAKKEVEMAAKRADRAKHDRMSGRELFSLDASLFVDDEDGFADYEREDRDLLAENEAEGANGTAEEKPGPSGIAPAVENGVDADEEAELDLEDDDDLNDDELSQLEASIAQTSLQEHE